MEYLALSDLEREGLALVYGGVEFSATTISLSLIEQESVVMHGYLQTHNSQSSTTMLCQFSRLGTRQFR